MLLDRSETQDAADQSETPGWVTDRPISRPSMPTAALHRDCQAFQPASGYSRCIEELEAADPPLSRCIPPGIGRRVHSRAPRVTRNRSLYDEPPAAEYVRVPIVRSDSRAAAGLVRGRMGDKPPRVDGPLVRSLSRLNHRLPRSELSAVGVSAGRVCRRGREK